MSQRSLAIITGAAGGIGSALVRAFAERGYRVSAWDVDATGLEQLTVADDRQVVDLTDLDAARQAMQRVRSTQGPVRVLVNNAIWRELVSMDEISLESWERTLRIGLTAPAFLARWAAESMADEGGVIINISSIMSTRGGAVSPAYAAAKGGLDALTFELASLYARRNIRVVGIRPGAVDTPLSRDYGEDSHQQDHVMQELRRWSEDHIPLGRWAQPEEIATIAAAIASDEAGYLTGTLIDVDGGWTHGHFPRSLRDAMRDQGE